MLLKTAIWRSQFRDILKAEWELQCSLANFDAENVLEIVEKHPIALVLSDVIPCDSLLR